MSDIAVRHAAMDDAPALLDIYNHYVRETPITFDLEPRTLAQRREWLAGFAPTGRYQCLVAMRDGRAIGWASSSRFKERQAYETSIETGIYLAPGETGRGLGRRLYAALFEALRGEDLHRAYGGVTQPNPASNRLHEAMGFVRRGVLPEIGRKFGRYWDVAFYVKPLGDQP
jgi:phosphinothricin acetyltransferase